MLWNYRIEAYFSIFTSPKIDQNCKKHKILKYSHTKSTMLNPMNQSVFTGRILWKILKNNYASCQYT